ncbi:kinase-like domain-containing protein [Gautieria morchelliformis]|nr:kinase-like domain-containing protein [Gautieria morchelliformis]
MPEPEQHPQVDFDCDDRGVTLYPWLTFWDSTRSWLAERGYTLFEYGYHWRKRYVGDVTYWAPKLNDASVSHVEHPYSNFGGDEEGMAVPPLSGRVVPRIAFAQDSLQRHTALRLTKKSSDEYKILQLLIKESSLQSLERFDGVLPPLDLVDLGDHCIVVMPRWGEFAYHPWFSTIREVVDYMRYWLKGLSFLHKHHIVHRDIKPENILVNHFGAFSHIEWNEMRRTLRRDGHLVYAIIDFDISIMFPPTATREECRLPSNLSWDGAYDQPHDTKQGELDYDPFAFDVGCLGVLFCKRFQHFTRTVPMFAPLMDRMTTRDLSRRLTASQALDFLESFASELTQEQLQLPALPWNPRNPHYEDYDRWEGLPDKFMKDWGHFREPKPSFQIILVRQICDYAWGYKLVRWLRRIHRFWKSSHF